MFTIYNILHGNLDVDDNVLFTRSFTSSTRGHSYKLFKPFASKFVRQHFYSCRIIEDWNALPNVIVEANSVDEFKATLDEYNKDILFLY